MTSKDQVPTTLNRRTQARISVQIPIEVRLPNRDVPVPALNQDISWGGAKFILGTQIILSEPLTSNSGIIRLIFPWKGGERITAEAGILRVDRLADGRYLVAVRFLSLSPRSQARLEKLLNMLHPPSKGMEGEQSAPLVSELEVTVNDAQDMRQTLAQIATGHLTVTAFEAYRPDQSIRLAIVGANSLPTLRLRARVVRVESVRTAGFAWAELYTIHVEFEHPLVSIKSFVDLLLDQLPTDWRDPASSYAQAPDWLRAIHVARPGGVVWDAHANNAASLSTLETHFPDALIYLGAVWGEPDAFDVRFQELTMGSHAEPGGWPDDAWEELSLLQDVHDRVFGMPNSRRNPLKGGRYK